MAKTRDTSGQIADALQALIEATGSAPPDYQSPAEAHAAGYCSVDDFASRVCVGRSTASRLLIKGVSTGKIEKARVKTGKTPATYYRVKR